MEQRFWQDPVGVLPHREPTAGWGADVIAGTPPRARRAFAALLSASALVSLSSAAQAQTAQTPPAEEGDLEDAEVITVIGTANLTAATVATRVPVEALATPYTVATLSSRVIEDSGASNLSDALRYLGTVGGTDNFGNAGEFFSSRGFQLAAGSNYFKDGLRYRKYAQVPLYDLDRIEVLRGPASIIYGALEPGGVINFVSRKPQDEFGARLSLRGGSHSYRQVTGDITGPIADGVKYRIQGMFEDAESFRDFVDNNTKGVNAVVDWDVTPSTVVTARASWFKDRRTGDRGTVLAYQSGGRFSTADGRTYDFAAVPRSRFFGEDFAENRFRDINLSLSVRQQIGSDWELRGDIIRSDQKEDRVYIWSIPDSQIVGDNGQLNRQIGDWDARLKGTLGRLELAGEVEIGPMTHKLLVGSEYEHFRNGRENVRYAFAPINIYDPVYLDTRPANGNRTLNAPFGSLFKSQGFYLQDVIEWGEHFVLLGGLRYDRVTDENTLNGARRYKETGFTPQAGLVWRPTPYISPYVSFTHSFTPQGGIDRFGEAFDAQKGKQIEGGIKVDLRSLRTIMTAAAFKLDRENLLVDDPGYEPFQRMSGLQRSKGVELSVDSAPVRGLRVNFNYNYLASIKYIVDDSYAGNTVPNAPKHALGTFVSYDFAREGVGTSVNAGITYVSRRYAHPNNSFYLPSYTLFDLGAKYHFNENVGISANVRNLFDATYYTGAINSTGIGVGTPRTFLVGLAFKI